MCSELSGPWAWSNQKATRKAAVQLAANICPTRGSLAYEGDVVVLFMRIFWKNVPNLVKSITFTYELHFLRSLYAREAKIMLYNFRLDFVG